MNSSLLSPREVKEIASASRADAQTIYQWRKEIINILNGVDQRLLLIVGPCAIHRTDAALEYAEKLTHLAQEVKDAFLIIMRTYVEKSRTMGGWKGFVYEEGFTTSRNLMLEISHLGLPLAMEFVNPFSAPYFDDIVSWGALGARSVSSQVHHELVSTLPMPVGIKNHLDGSTESALHAMIAAQQKGSCLGLDIDGKICLRNTIGNPHVHLVLRGGACGPNYETHHIQNATQLVRHANLCDAIIVDCSHGNSQKRWDKQSEILHTVLDTALPLNLPVKGFMVESFLLDGSQHEILQNTPYQGQDSLSYGTSVVDGCLGWDRTVDLVMSAYAKLKEVFSVRICLLIIGMFFCIGCSGPTIRARTFYTSRTDLASYIIDTPDPEKSTKRLGQTIWIRWFAPSIDEGTTVNVVLRFKDETERQAIYPIAQRAGWIMVEISPEERKKTNGLLSYRIELRHNETVLASTQHKLWTEKLPVIPILENKATQ